MATILRVRITLSFQFGECFLKKLLLTGPGVYYLTRLDSSCSYAHQPKATCKGNSHQTDMTVILTRCNRSTEGETTFLQVHDNVRPARRFPLAPAVVEAEPSEAAEAAEEVCERVPSAAASAALLLQGLLAAAVITLKITNFTRSSLKLLRSKQICSRVLLCSS